MFNKLKKHFDLSKSSGRFAYVVISYVLYIFTFYIVLPIIIFVLQDFNFGGIPFFVLVVIIAPVISYKIPASLVGIYKKGRLYTYHTIFILSFLVLYAYLLLLSLKLNIGGF